MPSAEIMWTIEDISRLAVVKSILSPVKFVEGAPCWLKATQECSERTDNEQYLSFYFYCNEESSYDLWTADLIFALTILNTDPTKNITPMRHTLEITSQLCSFGKPKFLLMQTALDADKGFIKDGSITVKADITLNNIFGISKPLEFDFASPGVLNDVTLLIEGKKVHVSKHYLALHSPVFATMFYQAFIEKGKTVIAMEDISHDEFIELLLVIYPSYRPITVISVPFILALADRFDIKVATNLAETYLIRSIFFTPAQKLLFADNYRLAQLQAHCFAFNLKTLSSIKKLEVDDEFTELSLEMRSKLLTRTMELIQ